MTAHYVWHEGSGTLIALNECDILRLTTLQVDDLADGSFSAIEYSADDNEQILLDVLRISVTP